MSKESYLNYNGNLYLNSELDLGINRAMRFGDGVFETIRVIDGELIWWKEHFDRLLAGMNYLHFDIPELFLDELLVDCLATLHRNRIAEGGILRVFVYRKGDGGYTPTSYQFNYLIETEALEHNHFVLNKKGLVIGISDSVRLYSGENQDVKTCNKISYVRAAAEKAKKGWDEILLLNEKGLIVEASSSNVFILLDDIWHTPSISQGALNGVTRKKIIEALLKEKQRVIQSDIRVSDLQNAQSIFICNSVSGVKWIGSFSKKRYFNKQATAIHQLLNELTA